MPPYAPSVARKILRRWSSIRWRMAAATCNSPDGTINVPVDAAHLLNGAAASRRSPGPSIGASLFGTGLRSWIKMMYQDEYLVGAEHEFKGGLVISGSSSTGSCPALWTTSPESLRKPQPKRLIDAVLLHRQSWARYGSVSERTCDRASSRAVRQHLADPLNIWVPALRVRLTTRQNTFAAGIQDANGGNFVNPATGQPWNGGNSVCWNQVNGFWGGEVRPANG